MERLSHRKLTKIIELSIKQTLAQIEGNPLKIVYNTYYGSYDLAPYNLVIWYFFKTDEEWKAAENNGFTNEIRRITITNIIKNGYPASAFEVNSLPLHPNTKFINISDENKDKLIDMMTHRKAMICFASEEDVKNKTGGNYYYYLK